MRGRDHHHAGRRGGDFAGRIAGIDAGRSALEIAPGWRKKVPATTSTITVVTGPGMILQVLRIAATASGAGIVFMAFGVPLVIFARQIARFNMRQHWPRDVLMDLDNPTNRKVRVLFRFGCALSIVVGLLGICAGLIELL
jgi:hypothetical protein